MRSIILALLGFALLTPARADGPPGPHQEHPENLAIHEQFYSNWMRPDNPGVSCCSLQDCEPVRHVRRVGERWEAQRESDGAWVIVPNHAIEQQRDSPDGRSHLCSRGVTVFCFVHGSGT